MTKNNKYYTVELIDAAIAGNRDAQLQLYTQNEALCGTAWKLYHKMNVDWYRGCLWELIATKLHLYKKLMIDKDRAFTTWVLGSMRKLASVETRKLNELIHIPDRLDNNFEFIDYDNTNINYKNNDLVYNHNYDGV